MGWSVGYDSFWQRDIGYEVPAICDHPGCNNEIDRGLTHVCGGEPRGGDKGCGLYFCGDHLSANSLCEQCDADATPFTPKPDTLTWIGWKLTDKSWEQWREENPGKVSVLQSAMNDAQ